MRFSIAALSCTRGQSQKDDTLPVVEDVRSYTLTCISIRLIEFEL